MTKEDRNQHREGMETGAFHEDDAGDPAAAFEALRETIEDLAADLGREMTTIRKGVESTFDQFERQGAPVDYSAELGRMTQQLATVGERLQAVEKSPVLRHGVDHYTRVFESSGRSLVSAAAEQFQHESRAFRSAAQNLINQTDSARNRRRQDWWLVGVGGAGIVLGVLLTLFTPRVLPFSAAPRVASTVIGDTAWNAGMSLLSFSSPESVQRVAAADRLIEVNKDAVADCRAAAAKAGKEQKCTIIVPVPEKAQ